MMQNVSNSSNLQHVNRQYMTTDQFCFWLQGLFELCPELTSLNDNQVKMIRQHLEYVFNGKTQSGNPVSTLTTTTTTSPTTPGYPGTAQGVSGFGHAISSIQSDGQPFLTIC